MHHKVAPLLLLGLVCSVASTGCGSRGAGGDEAGLELRAGAVRFFEGPDINQNGLDPLSIVRTGAGLLDVSRDGDRLVAVVRVSSGPVTVWHSDPSCSDCPMSVGSAGGSVVSHFLVSEDLGKSWTEHPLEQTEGQGPSVHGVHLYGGKAALVTYQSVKNPLGTYETYPVRLVDFSTDTYVASPMIDDTPSPVELMGLGPNLVGARVYADGHTNRRTLTTVSYSLTDGTSRQASATTITDVLPWGRLFSSEGQAFESFGYHRSPNGFCHINADLTRESPLVQLCVDGYLLPSTFNSMHWGLARTTAGVAGILSDDQHSYAMRIAVDPLVDPSNPSAATMRLIGLGAGAYFDEPRLHPAFGELVRLRSGGDGTERLVDLRPEGTELVVLPTTPCQNASACGQSVTRDRVIPLGGDEYLSFYSVETQAWPNTHRFFYMTREKATRESFVGPTEPGEYSGTGLKGYPNALEASQLEKACMAATRCGLSTQEECVIHWRTGPFANPALQLFLTAPLDDCTSIQQFWPEKGLGAGGCESVCVNDVLVGGCVGDRREPIDCRYYGATCEKDGYNAQCSDSSASLANGVCSENGSAVYQVNGHLVAENCPALGGRSCQPGVVAGTVLCGFPAETVPACEGDVAVYAAVAGAAAQKADCALEGRHCAMKDGRAFCEAPPKSEECGSGYYSNQCQGPYLVYCTSNTELHYLDCREFGGYCVNAGQTEVFSGVPTCL